MQHWLHSAVALLVNPPFCGIRIPSSTVFDLMQRSFQCFQDHVCTGLLITFQSIYQFCNFFGSMDVCRSASRYIPSSTAALVAFSASSIRSFASFISVSVAAPTRITATPPASFASLSCSFSLSNSDVVLLDLALICAFCFDCLLYRRIPSTITVFSFCNFYRFCTSKLSILHLSDPVQVLRKLPSPPVRIAISLSIFSSVTITRSFYTYYIKGSTQFVHDQSRQSFSLDILCDDQRVLLPTVQSAPAAAESPEYWKSSYL